MDLKLYTNNLNITLIYYIPLILDGGSVKDSTGKGAYVASLVVMYTFNFLCVVMHLNLYCLLVWRFPILLFLRR
jgi:hypothetical protein